MIRNTNQKFPLFEFQQSDGIDREFNYISDENCYSFTLNKDNKEAFPVFTLSKNNELYEVINQLYNDLREAKVVEVTENDKKYGNVEELYEYAYLINEEFKNTIAYKSMIETRSILFISEDDRMLICDSKKSDMSNYKALRIEKLNEEFRLIFYDSENIYESSITVRIKKSLSRYGEFLPVIDRFDHNLRKLARNYKR